MKTMFARFVKLWLILLCFPRGGTHHFPRHSDTLILKKIPRELNTITKLSAHFEKFGTIINLQVCCIGAYSVYRTTYHVW